MYARYSGIFPCIHAHAHTAKRPSENRIVRLGDLAYQGEKRVRANASERDRDGVIRVIRAAKSEERKTVE